MGPTKVVRIDKFSQLWHIIGSDVGEVLNKGLSLEPLNVTNIILLLKISQSMNLSNFKPISLCNVLYKIISKAIANHLQQVLDIYINEPKVFFSQAD
ncbi:reverse transcriptase [Gossypium australe]|uniref:Reverse transcriptase n=1 Tax=Gossypium australe TaxID=47621 RepID=A0A5B6WN19_9ROSI|nr:reverse transcriptase [Gossypium australe]